MRKFFGITKQGSALALTACASVLLPTGVLRAQQSSTEPPSPTPVQSSRPAAPAAHGEVLFSSQHPPPAAKPAYSSSDAQQPTDQQGGPDVRPQIPVKDSERGAVQIADYDLSLHLTPATAGEEVEAKLTLHNVSRNPLDRVALDLSSTLRWQAISIRGKAGLEAAKFTQSPVATDADHTGYAQEAVIALPTPLAPGQSLSLSALYGGAIHQSAARLELIGTEPLRANNTDWDAIVPTSDTAATALRGFGDVLWYPVAAPLALLGDGNKLFSTAAEQRHRNTSATVALHLTVEYTGDPPDGVVFDSELKPLTHVADEEDQLIAHTRGVATADFARAPIGLRLPSLFLTAQTPTVAADGVLSIITPRPENDGPYAEAAQSIAPLLSSWFGPSPIQPLVLLDHPGEPFADHALLVGQLAADARPLEIAPLVVDGMTHAWFHSAHPWISEGVAEFMRLLWTEKVQGREAALAELATIQSNVAFAEPGASQPATPSASSSSAPDVAGGSSSGQALVDATSQVVYRMKAATVWWQLREMLGEATLEKALIAYRKDEAANPEFDRDPKAMQKVIERTSGHTLDWFFDDWVYHDRGLPDLSIVEVNPRPAEVGTAKSGGYLVAVEVRNAGGAAAEVPVTVSSGSTLTATERLRIPAHSSAATRILFGGTPETVQVNDGSVPEIGGSATHTRRLDMTIDRAPTR